MFVEAAEGHVTGLLVVVLAVHALPELSVYRRPDRHSPLEAYLNRHHLLQS